jgi:hypothetical protein
MVSELIVHARFRCCFICSTPLDQFEVSFVGLGNDVVVAMSVGGSKASHIKLVLQREPCTGKTWLHVCSILRNEEHVDATFRELFEKSCLNFTPDDLTLL